METFLVTLTELLLNSMDSLGSPVRTTTSTDLLTTTILDKSGLSLLERLWILLPVLLGVVWALSALESVPALKLKKADWGEKTVAGTSAAVIATLQSLKLGAEKLRWQTLFVNFYFIIKRQ